jgi:uncharacterized membrane protein required for colicin V production
MLGAFFDFLEAIPVIGVIIGWFRKPKPPADSALGRVRAATEAAKKVDNSEAAINADPDNIDGSGKH